MPGKTRADTPKILIRTASILDAFTSEKPERGIRDLAEQLCLPSSSVQRIATALVALDYLEQHPVTGKYRLGLKLLQLGSRVHTQRDFRRQIRSTLEGLVHETGESAYLATLTPGGQAIYIDKVFTPATIRAMSSGSDISAPESSAIGRVLLAYSPRDEVARHLRGQPIKARTPDTVTDPEALLAILTQVRTQGYALDQEEYEKGLWCLAVPVLGSGAQLLGSLAILGPTSRMSGYARGQLLQALGAAAAAIAGELEMWPFEGPAAGVTRF